MRSERSQNMTMQSSAPSKGILKKSTRFETFDSSSPDEGFSDELKKVRQKIGTWKTISFVDQSKNLPVPQFKKVGGAKDQAVNISMNDMNRLIDQSAAMAKMMKDSGSPSYSKSK